MNSDKMPDEFQQMSDKNKINSQWDELVGKHNPPKTYLATAILATILCFPITGIIAICYSTQVNTFCHVNNFTAANYAAKKARLWCILSPITFIALLVVIYFLRLLQIVDFEISPQGFLTPFLPVPDTHETISP